MQDPSALVTPPPHRPRSRSVIVLLILLAFLLGATLVAWAATRGYLTGVLETPAPRETQAAAIAALDEELATAPRTPAAQMAAIGSVEGRLAMLEDRISRLDFQTRSASGNAARAEGLLIAYAARRLIDRGEPLGYVTDQLRLRFTNAQPRAVQTVLDFARNPVTIDTLAARLEALSPELSVTESDGSLWDRARHEISSLFVVRRDSSALLTPSARIDRARLMLEARRIDSAIDAVERLPGADSADIWIADARRYEEAQRALDLLETTAMLEPSRLQDGAGRSVEQPSPLASPATMENPTPEATGPVTPAP